MKPIPDSSDDSLDRLFAAARARRPDTAAAEFGLETRVLARIRERREQPAGAGLWATLSWKAAPLFATIVLLTGLGALHAEQTADDAQRLVLDPQTPAALDFN